SQECELNSWAGGRDENLLDRRALARRPLRVRFERTERPGGAEAALRPPFDRQASHRIQHDMGLAAESADHQCVAELMNETRAKERHEPNEESNSLIFVTCGAQAEQAADQPEKRM